MIKDVYVSRSTANSLEKNIRVDSPSLGLHIRFPSQLKAVVTIDRSDYMLSLIRIAILAEKYRLYQKRSICHCGVDTFL